MRVFTHVSLKKRTDHVSCYGLTLKIPHSFNNGMHNYVTSQLASRLITLGAKLLYFVGTVDPTSHHDVYGKGRGDMGPISSPNLSQMKSHQKFIRLESLNTGHLG